MKYTRVPKTRKGAPYSGVLQAINKLPTRIRARKAGTYIIAGSRAWQKAKEIENTHRFVMLPPGDDPAQYDWSLLAGHDPIVTLVAGDPLTKDEYDALATALMRDGVQRFLCPAGDGCAVRYLSSEVVR